MVNHETDEAKKLAAVLADQAEAAGALDLLALEIRRRSHLPTGTVRTPAISWETAEAVTRALRRVLRMDLQTREGSLTPEAWTRIATELHGEGVETHWSHLQPNELRICEGRRPVARIVYDQMRYRLRLEPLELER